MASTLTEVIDAKKVKVPKNLATQRKVQREKVVEILSRPLLPIEQEKVYETLEEYVKLSFGYDLLERYSHIASSFFDLKRDIEVEVQPDRWSKTKYQVTVPSVIGVPLDERNKSHYKTRVTGKDVKNIHNTQTLELSCVIPEITPEAEAAYAESIAFSAELVSRAYRDDLISRILVKNGHPDIPTPIDADYFLVWAPSIWDANVIPRVERDPAIFMQYNGWNFLVHQWDVPEERSLDAMLREFRETLK